MKIFLVAVSGLLIISTASAQQKATAVHTPQPFRILALFENGGHHLAFTDAARPWLDSLAVRHSFSIDYIHSTDTINDAVLNSYQLFLQLDYPPYGWTKQAQQAFIQYTEQGRGGWIGLHHASLLGNFDGYNMWPWFYDFMGSIQFKDYIPTFVSAQVHIEDTSHPCVKGLPENFIIEKEEWYTYDKSPRPNVHVIASVDEKTYVPDSPVKMSDHPVIWTNDHYPVRNIYIFMGHSPDLFNNKVYTMLLENAILWASQK